MAESDDKTHDEFMELFLENQPRVYAYIRSLLFQRADADDVMQETASVLWRKFSEFELGTDFDRWALRTAFHQVRYFRQKKARESKRLQFGDDLVEILAVDAEDLVDSTEDTMAALEVCLRKLPPKQRDLVRRRYEGGATNRSLAKRIGKSESALSRTMSKIYESLLKCINLQLKLETP